MDKFLTAPVGMDNALRKLGQATPINLCILCIRSIRIPVASPCPRHREACSKWSSERTFRECRAACVLLTFFAGRLVDRTPPSYA